MAANASGRSGELIRVRATAKGFYDILRKPGDIFNVAEECATASWYVPVGLDGNVNKPETNETPELDDEDSNLDDDDEMDFDKEADDIIGG